MATILWESAWNALIRAIIFLVLGSVAIGILTNIFREMAPAHPPMTVPLAAQSYWPFAHRLRAFVTQHVFWIIFCLLFPLIAGARLVPYLRHPKHRSVAALLLRANRRICSHWFRLFVLNAFGAWIATVVLVAVQQFSWAQLAWDCVGSVMQPLFQALASWCPGGQSISRWFVWYLQNQGKFLFWLLYSAAICDDLGLPNYKTLTRLAVRTIFNKLAARWRGPEHFTAFH